MKTGFTFIVLFLLGPSFCLAQQGEPSELYLKTYTGSGKVLLRWAPGDKNLWHSAMESGYTLTRKTITRNNEVLEVPEREIIASGMTPASLEVFATSARSEPIVGVVAQAIHGKEFMTSGAPNSGLVSRMILEADELTQRYVFCLYASDQSFRAATLAGLAFTDETVKQYETYLYEIAVIGNNAPEKVKALAYVIPEHKTRLPKPDIPAAVAQDSLVVITWNFESHKYHFSAYDLERSYDGKAFEPVNTQPLAPTHPDEQGNINYIDQPGNHGKFWYRVVGRDYFGNRSMPSESFMVQVIPALRSYPEITGYETGKEGEIILQWLLHQHSGAEVSHLQLLNAHHPTAQFTRLEDSILPSAGQIQIKQKDAIGYYRLRTVDAYGQYLESNTFQVQLVDSIPPGIPKNLRLKTLENDTIQLNWTPSGDDDIKGYDVFIAPGTGLDFVQLNTQPVTDSLFFYPLEGNKTMSRIYFSVRAVDERYNVSERSDSVVYIVPRPLVAPVFTGYQYRAESGLELRWTTQDHPGLEFFIYRQDKNLASANTWKLIAVLEDLSNYRYTDPAVLPGQGYRYLITSNAADKEESKPSEVLNIKLPIHPLRESPGKLWVTPNRVDRVIELRWKLNPRFLQEVALYRKTGSGKYTLYKTFSGGVSRYTDSEIYPNNTYGYLVTGLYSNGEKKVLPESLINF